MAATPVIRKLQQKQNSGVSHWAAIGNPKTTEIKDKREVLISEETLLSVSSIQQSSGHKVLMPTAFVNTCAIAQVGSHNESTE